MFRKTLTILVLLATIQLTNASDDMKQYKQIDVNIKAKTVNIFKDNNSCNIFNNSNNNNSIDFRYDGMSSTIEQQQIIDILKRYINLDMFKCDLNGIISTKDCN